MSSPSVPGASGPFADALEAIYATAGATSLWPDALQAIADCFGDLGAILIFNRDDGSTALLASPTPLLKTAGEESNRHWWRQDFRLQRSFERGYVLNSDSITDRHVVTEEEIATHPFYAEYLASYGLKWFAGTTLSPDPRAWVGLSVQRAATKPPFSDEELALLARLGRHAENALRLGIRLLDADAASLSLGEALSRLGIGVFMLDRAKRLAWMNPRGERLLGDALLLAQDRLTARYAPEREALDSAVAAILEMGASSGDPRPVILRGLDPERFLAVYVLPAILPSGPVGRWLANARACVVAIAPQPGSPADPAIVRDLLGLTLGEARVAALVGAGLPPRETAERLGIAEATVRSALKNVFSKTGVARQSELAALLGRLVLR